MNLMLKLTDIKVKNEYIEAHYTPEDSLKKGFLRLDGKDKVIDSLIVEGYERTYPFMAKKALKEISDSVKSNPNYEIPKEKIVMWY